MPFASNSLLVTRYSLLITRFTRFIRFLFFYGNYPSKNPFNTAYEKSKPTTKVINGNALIIIIILFFIFSFLLSICLTKMQSNQLPFGFLVKYPLVTPYSCNCNAITAKLFNPKVLCLFPFFSPHFLFLFFFCQKVFFFFVCLKFRILNFV